MSELPYQDEARRRRTFAIISHPDAGKTTLTENLLYAAGALHLAGQVAARGQNRRTSSDWMKIERERGISVSSSVMTFAYRDCMINLLDTPGHEDFSEDTYRTLTAADSAVMVLDAAKGIEPQTLKLFEVCRLRDIPILTFINKMDREARDPLEILEEIAEKLALDVVPMQWPAGSGARFSGVQDLRKPRFLPFSKGQTEALAPMALDDPTLEKWLFGAEREELEEAVELADGGFAPFELSSYLEGHLTPVYFGSALRKFGVLELLDALVDLAPPPAKKQALRDGADIWQQPGAEEVSGFVFKVQANMDPNHRDRIAFTRLSSGQFKRGMKLKTTAGKTMTVSSPLMFFAQDREIADIAYAGDVIGVPNHGVLRVGDSLSESGKLQYPGLPNFAPEMLRRARPKDPMKAKHLRKALESLAEEGVTQLFKPMIGAEMILGAVGQLQIEVTAERIATEYKLDVLFEPCPYSIARWIVAKDDAALENFADRHKMQIAEDVDGAQVFLAKNAWEINYAQEKFPDIKFTATKER
ncbi:Peptide chain release factor 3 [hydrothermal vent metagenome]|uniref:Peptide chain release factor 3 n=1 Tax=hydrothermal vent metagenome TaxID=652676 RepID=A0A3B0RHN6_9ZZZZ